MKIQPWPLWSYCFLPDSSVCETLFLPSKCRVFVSPSLVELLSSNSTGLQSQMLWRLFFLLPHSGEPDVGLRTLIFMGEPLWFFFQFMSHSPSAYEIWSCHQNIPPFIALWLLSFLMQNIFLVSSSYFYGWLFRSFDFGISQNQGAAFSLDASCLFPQHVLAIISLLCSVKVQQSFPRQRGQVLAPAHGFPSGKS